MVLIVTYDLHNAGRDYDAISKTLMTAPSWKHPQGSVWFLDTTLSPADWRDKLMKAGDANDEYFVAKMSQNWASYNSDADVTEWLNSRSW